MRGFVPAALAALVVALILDYLIYGLALHGSIANSLAIEGPDPWPKLYGELLFAPAFTWIYSKGVQDGPALPQGLRYGLAVGIMFYGAGMLMTKAMVDLAPSFVAAAAGLGIAKTIILGAVVALIVGPRTTPR
jgi:hypothetical protein